MPYFEQPDGFRTWYDRFDGAPGPAVLAVHGNVASNAWWEPAVRALDGAAGTWIPVEWRGCGRSHGARGPADFDLALLAADAIRVLRHLGVESAHVVGHSTGGLIALHALRQAPSLFRRALLLDPVGPTGIDFTPPIRERFLSLRSDLALRDAVVTATIHGGCEPATLARILHDARGVHPLLWTGVPEMLHLADSRGFLGELPHPTLVLHGEHDLLLPQSDSRALAHALPHGEFRELPGRGHSCNVEDPALFARLVREFFGAPAPVPN